MDVQMEDVLPARGPVRLEERHAVCPETVSLKSSDELSRTGHGGRLLRRGIEQIGCMLTRNHECVPGIRRGEVEERDRVVVLKHHPAGPRAGDNLAEDAFEVSSCHASSVPDDHDGPPAPPSRPDRDLESGLDQRIGVLSGAPELRSPRIRAT